jgi:hypothetical protein
VRVRRDARDDRVHLVQVVPEVLVGEREPAVDEQQQPLDLGQAAQSRGMGLPLEQGLHLVVDLVVAESNHLLVQDRRGLEQLLDLRPQRLRLPVRHPLPVLHLDDLAADDEGVLDACGRFVVLQAGTYLGERLRDVLLQPFRVVRPHHREGRLQILERCLEEGEPFLGRQGDGASAADRCRVDILDRWLEVGVDTGHESVQTVGGDVADRLQGGRRSARRDAFFLRVVLPLHARDGGVRPQQLRRRPVPGHGLQPEQRRRGVARGIVARHAPRLGRGPLVGGVAPQRYLSRISGSGFVTIHDSDRRAVAGW